MRLIGTLAHENEARRLSQYLKSQQIANSWEVSFEPTLGDMSYQIWVHEEDKIDQASHIFAEFHQNPFAPRFDPPLVQEVEPEPVPLEEEGVKAEPKNYAKPYLTYFFLGLCSLIFFMNFLEQLPLRREGLSQEAFILTPLSLTLMFDLPPAFDKLESVIEKYENLPNRLPDMPPEVKTALQEVSQAPFWRGIYDWVVLKIKKQDTTQGEGPLFYRIRQGEIWRLFSPCILHSYWVHILFNMLWLWYLGRPIEQRIGLWRTFLLTLLSGIGSNVLQYLMSGPLFIGYSGIVMALAGFIWMREKIAPWEGYPLNQATIWFLLFFLLAIFGLQIALFFIEIFANYRLPLLIANTAHISGVLLGAALARSSFFAQRVRK